MGNNEPIDPFCSHHRICKWGSMRRIQLGSRIHPYIARLQIIPDLKPLVPEAQQLSPFVSYGGAASQ